MVTKINQNDVQPPKLPQLKAEGEMSGRTVKVENGDTKSAGLFRRAMSSAGSFLLTSAKFIIKATLFVTMITPLLALTKFFWNCINPKKESKDEFELPLVVAANDSRRSSASEKDMDDLCEQLESFHASDVEEDHVSKTTAAIAAPTAAALHILVAANDSRRSSASEKDMDDLCEQLGSFHASDVEEDHVSETTAAIAAPTAAALHKAIQEQIEEVEQNVPAPAPAAQKKGKKAKQTTAPAAQEPLRRSARSNKGKAPNRFGFE